MKCRRWCCKSFMKHHRSTLINSSDAALAKRWPRDAFRLLALRRLGCSSSRWRIISAWKSRFPQQVYNKGRGKKEAISRSKYTRLSRKSQFIYLFIRPTDKQRVRVNVEKPNVDALSFSLPSTHQLSPPEKVSPRVLRPFLSIINLFIRDNQPFHYRLWSHLGHFLRLCVQRI